MDSIIIYFAHLIRHKIVFKWENQTAGASQNPYPPKTQHITPFTNRPTNRTHQPTPYTQWISSVPPLSVLPQRKLLSLTSGRLSLTTSSGGSLLGSLLLGQSLLLLLGLLLLLLLLPLQLLGSGLLGLDSLLLAELLTTVGLAPLLQLGSGDLGEQKLGGADGLAGLEDIRVPGVGDDNGNVGLTLGSLEANLAEDRLGGAGHVRGQDTSNEVEKVEGKVDDSVAALGLLGKKLVAELVVLEQLVTDTRDGEDGSKTGTELGALDLLVVLLEELVDLLLVLVKRRDGSRGVSRDLSVELGLAELDDTLAKVAKVLEEVVVVGVNELLPLELGVTRLGTSGEEVVSPDIRVDASIPGVVTENTDALGLAELAALVVEVLGRGQVVNLGPVLLCTQLRAGEDDGMEADTPC